MKKLLFVTIFILTGLYAFAQDAFIDQLTGTVMIKQPKEESFKTANKGDKIFKDTIIQTSFRSYAIIKIGGTMITVRPLTTLSLTEIQNLEEGETLNVNLQAGRVRVDVKPPAGKKASTTLTSPSSVASVRGTNFEFDIHNLYVKEGVVSFAGNNGRTVLVNAGERSRADRTGQVSIPWDDKKANLMPPSPAGTGAKEMPASSVTAANSQFSINVKFY
jgi:hypothetical protein